MVVDDERLCSRMVVGQEIIVRQHGYVLTAIVEEVQGELIRIRVSSPWGHPCAFAEWWRICDVNRPHDVH